MSNSIQRFRPWYERNLSALVEQFKEPGRQYDRIYAETAAYFRCSYPDLEDQRLAVEVVGSLVWEAYLTSLGSMDRVERLRQLVWSKGAGNESGD